MHSCGIGIYLKTTSEYRLVLGRDWILIPPKGDTSVYQGDLLCGAVFKFKFSEKRNFNTLYMYLFIKVIIYPDIFYCRGKLNEPVHW